MATPSPTTRKVLLQNVTQAWLEKAAQDPSWETVTTLHFVDPPRNTRGAFSDPVLPCKSRPLWVAFWTSPHLRNLETLIPELSLTMMWPEALESPDFLPGLQTIELRYQTHEFGTKSLNYQHIKRGDGLPAQTLPLVAAHQNKRKKFRPVLQKLLEWTHIRHGTLYSAKGSLGEQAAHDVIASPLWAQIEELVIDAWAQNDGLAVLLEHLAHLGVLKRLALHRHFASDTWGNDAIQHAAQISSLTALEILCMHQGGHVLQQAMRNFALQSQARLTTFRSMSSISAATMHAMAQSPAFADLEVLDINIGWLYIKEVMKPADFHNVRTLDLSRVREIKPGDLQAILAAPVCQNLTELRLDRNRKLGNKAALMLAKCRALQSLQVLSLSYCGIKKDGALALAQSPYLSESIRKIWHKKANRMKK